MDVYKKTGNNSIGILELFSLLKQNLKFFLIFGIVFGIIGFSISAFFMKPVYEASAKMIVNTSRGESYDITSDQITSAQNLVKTYAIIIRGRTVLQQVIEELDLSVSCEELQDAISVSSVDGTQVMDISVRDGNPDLAEHIAAKILEISPEIIIDAVEAGSVKTIEKAHQSAEPVAPDKLKITILAAFTGFMTAFLLVMLRFVFDMTYKSEQDIQTDLGIPVLGVIPSTESCLRTRRDKREWRQQYGSKQLS